MVCYTYHELVQMYSVESTSSSRFLRIFPRRRAWGICVNRLCGSPIDRYELYGNQWIVEVNKKETPERKIVEMMYRWKDGFGKRFFLGVILQTLFRDREGRYSSIWWFNFLFNQKESLIIKYSCKLSSLSLLKRSCGFSFEIY